MLGSWFHATGEIGWFHASTFQPVTTPTDLWHLRVTKALVDDHAPHQCGVLQLPAHLALHLNEFKVHVVPLHIDHTQHCLHGNLSYLTLTPVDAAQDMARSSVALTRQHKKTQLSALALRSGNPAENLKSEPYSIDLASSVRNLTIVITWVWSWRHNTPPSESSCQV
jgi:hypothetical protein